MKRMIALLVGLSLIFSSATISVTAANFDDIFIAVNTNTTDTAIEGKFTVKDEINSNISELKLQTAPEYDGLNDVYSAGIDEDGFIIMNPNLPEFTPDLSDKSNSDIRISDSELSYKVGGTKTITTYDEKTEIGVECLYIGTHCTVWVQTDCDSNIQLTSQQAKKIGEEFDSKMLNFAGYFPDAEKIDCDNDGRIGIYCYDIDKNYGTTGITSYNAGYFWSYDFSLNNTDMIHIDTYPGMGSGTNYLQNIERCYGTLFHEYQHYINYSARYYNYHPIETYLNEAFSMAVEQLIYGSDSMNSRISYFNSNMTTITNGLAMTVWNNSNSLPQYSLSYVFGQYLRIRYNQLNGVKENMLFNEVMKKLATTKSYINTLDIIAGLLNTSKEELTKDFWIALYLRENTGKYGFNGDDCIKNLNNVYINTKVTSDTTKGIYNGGVKFYGISSDDEVRITSYSNLSFYFGNSNTMGIEPDPEPSLISRILDILLAPFRVLLNGFNAIWQAIFGGNKNVEYEVSLLKDGVNVATVLTTATSYDFTKEIMKNGIGIYSVIVTALGDGITTANSESVQSENTFTYNGSTSILSGVTISNQCVVKVSSGKGGSISQEGTLVVPTGINIKFNVIPDEGYEIKDVLINGISIGSVSSCKYTADISLPYSTIYAEFAKITVDDVIYEPPNIDPVPVD